MSIRWITSLLGTAPALSMRLESDMNIIDVRDLVDKSGNRVDVVRQKINEGCDSLRQGKKTIVCCDYGISRSNAIAVGILSLHESITYEEAVRRVLKATEEKEIKVEPLQAVRKALEQDLQNNHQNQSSILVTGGSGFLGEPIVAELSKTFNVLAPTRSQLDLNDGSTQLDLIVGEKNVECIVHLANPRVYTSNIALGSTLTMLRNVLDVCVSRNLKLIYLSGWEVYSGYRSINLIADESLPLLPKGPYAETKYLCEMLIEHSKRSQGLNCTILRSSPVYGVGGEKPKFIYNFIDKIKQRQNVVTHRYMNGLPALDLLYIDDLVKAVSSAVINDFSGNLNIGTGCLTSTNKIAEILQDQLKETIEIQQAHIQSDVACIAMDSTNALKTLGWEPTITVEQGLSLIINNFEKN